MKYRIAFQGGGAKFFPLIEAVEAIQSELRTNDDFELDLISGASAGCLAAICLAANIDLTLVKEYFGSKAGRKFFNKTFPPINLFVASTRVLTGRTVFKEGMLEALILKLFEINGISDRKKKVELKYPLRVAITNLGSSTLEMVDLDDSSLENIVKNLADSCSIPFVIKNHRRREGWEYVDGGLFENFPISELIEDGFPQNRVLGFSFQKPKPSVVENANFLTYSKAVISTAVDANIDASLRLINSENVFQVRTSLSTFEFKKSLEQYLDDSELSQGRINEISVWLKKICKREELLEARIGDHKNSPIPNSFKAMCDVTNDLFASRYVEHDKSRMTAYLQLNSLFPKFSPTYSDYDYFVTETVYDVPEDGLECIQVMTSTTSIEQMGLYSDIIVLDEHECAIEYFTYPIRLKPTDALSFGVFFRQPVQQDQTKAVKLIKKELIKGGFSRLMDHGIDHIEISSRTGNIHHAQIFVGMPREEKPKYSLSIVNNSYSDETKEVNFLSGVCTRDSSDVRQSVSAGVDVVGFICDFPIKGTDWFSVEILEVAK